MKARRIGFSTLLLGLRPNCVASISVVLILAGKTIFPETASAESAIIKQSEQSAQVDRAPAARRSRGEYDFSWLDPDKKIYVLQNRKYLKANHFLFSGLMGLGLSNPYRNTYNFDGRVAYYFTEGWGLELFYVASINTNNNTHKALINSSSTAKPVLREIKSEYGALVHWAPWYAKINVFNTVLYFDWFFMGGLGRVNTEIDTNTATGRAAILVEQNFNALFLGTGHQYHLSQRLVVRLDFLGAIYRARIFGTAGESAWFTNYNFNIGAGFRL